MNEPCRPRTSPPKATSTCRRCAARSSGRTSTARRARCSTRDADVFLHQSLSTPCFDALAVVRRHLAHRRRRPAHHGFPRQQRPPGRLSPSARDGRGARAARHAAVLAAPLHERAAVDLAHEARRARARSARQGAVRARRHARDRHGAEARARRHRPPQDAVAVGLVPRRVARRDLDRRRGRVPQGDGAAPARHRARAALRSAACRFGCGGTCNARCAEYLDYVLGKEEDIGAVIIETIRSTDVADPAARVLPDRPRRLRPSRRAPDPRRGSRSASAAPAGCSRSSITASFPTWSCSARAWAARCSRWRR